ncbi:membrane protein [Steroidobacter agaridevorans]|nr:membrane protein [Steroidobacter agaridevorans]
MMGSSNSTLESSMTVRAMFVSFGCLLAASAGAAPPSKNDYASGMSVRANYSQPMVETVLPDDVYRAVTRADLGDLRVFNADGMPVPHAFCAGLSSTTAEVTERSLPVFVLRGRDPVYTDNSRVAVETPSGTRVNVEESLAAQPEVVSGLIHIIDAREAPRLRAIRFDWRSPDGASEVKVRIEASEDLDRWQTIVPASTLLLAQQGDQELRRERIELLNRDYKYLRVQRVDSGPPLILNSVTAEQVGAAEEIEPLWFNALHMASKEADVLYFDSEHLAPVTYARVRLAQQNSTVSVSLQSRPDEESPWRSRWTGESYVIVSDTVRRESPPAQFPATTDRYWRLQILKDPQVYQDSTLELGYRPAKLRFVTQGPGPFTVAFGSRRAEPAQPAACDGLLANISGADRERMIEQGFVDPVVQLGGADALKPVPKKTPAKVVVLWVVLVVGVALLVGMALSLLKRVRHPTN